MEKIIHAQCPFCKQKKYRIEKYGNNLYLLSCASENTVMARWYEVRTNYKWARVNII